MSVAPESGRNRIMIYGPKNNGTYVVEFKTADGEALAISVPVGETRALKRFQGHAISAVRAGRSVSPKNRSRCPKNTNQTNRSVRYSSHN
jgi:hypothetical protein